MQKNYLHNTVLLNEAVDSLNIRTNGVYIDGTFGCGGHSRLILSKLDANGRLFAFDRDLAAVTLANTINDRRFTIIHGLFSSMSKYMTTQNMLGKINGILLDLGVSSMHIDDPERGFSFMHDGPLDMRMDNTHGQSAMQWLAQASIKDIAQVLKKFGQERFAKRIARAIVTRNYRQKPMTRTKELVSLITRVIMSNKQNKHLATRSFQAIRIHINNELEEIECALNSTLTLLAPNGRLSIISFNSLEDRLVKKFIHKHSTNRSNIPIGLPLTENQIAIQFQNQSKLKKVSKLRPSSQEIKNNPRARSAILRIAEKLL